MRIKIIEVEPYYLWTLAIFFSTTYIVIPHMVYVSLMEKCDSIIWYLFVTTWIVIPCMMHEGYISWHRSYVVSSYLLQLPSIRCYSLSLFIMCWSIYLKWYCVFDLHGENKSSAHQWLYYCCFLDILIPLSPHPSEDQISKSLF